ncbi:MAG: hypothetical protein RMJ35_00170, partial [Phycisphaerales bacterium]|nr:hypothetical protein [Phycisphaerales bacterium]
MSDNHAGEFPDPSCRTFTTAYRRSKVKKTKSGQAPRVACPWWFEPLAVRTYPSFRMTVEPVIGLLLLMKNKGLGPIWPMVDCTCTVMAVPA